MPQETRTFRIFVSSTFSDLKEERNALQEKVFPKLRDLCMQHGCRFQAIDLRWGVSREAAHDQQTMNICLQELKRCQQITPKPNFIVLLGDKYGWCPLPPQIEAEEFEEILSRIPPEERDLLLWDEKQPDNKKGWYRKDENAVPTEYCLRPREVKLPDNASSKERKDVLEKEDKEWKQIEESLRAVILCAIDKLGWPEDDPRRIRYEASATHQEILHGALTVSDAHEHVYCFFRNIENLPQDPIANDFIDINEKTGRLDNKNKAPQKLESLKDSLYHYLKGNIFEYKARWTGNAAITYNHIDKLCDDAYSALSKVIIEQATALEKADELGKEVEGHESWGKVHSWLFTGRASLLQRINDYLKGSDTHPLVIFGKNGIGKSALMARAVELSQREHPSATVIFRFIGATPSSSDGRALLESLCRQISRYYGADEPIIPKEYIKLLQEFPKRLTLATKERPLFMFLDALDQLSDNDRARSLFWLPAHLPQHVRLIVSCLPGECLSVLQRKLPPLSLVELEPMPLEEGGKLLDRWLKGSKRTLQSLQRNEVLDKFRWCGLPLYLKLVFEEVRHWKSYTENMKISSDISGIIRDLFRRLSAAANHGQIIVSRSLGYLASAKNGLSEDELLDLLSADEEVMNDFISRSLTEQIKPIAQRLNTLPVLIWSRLYFDLAPYLTVRNDNGANLITFYHPQFGEVVVQDYLASAGKQDRHHSMADYFMMRGYKYPRTLDELPYQLYQFALESNDCQRLYELVDDVSFRMRQFQHFNSPQPIITNIGYALDLAFQHNDLVQVIHFSTVRLNINRDLSKTFLYRFTEIAKQNLELSRGAISLISDPTHRRMGLVLLACLFCKYDEQRELASGLVQEAKGIRVTSSVSQTPVLLEMIKFLYCAGIEEAKQLLSFIPKCPAQQLYLKAWSRASGPLQALAEEIGRVEADARTTPEGELREFSRLESFVGKWIIKPLPVRNPMKFEERLAELFGPGGVSNAYFLMAAEEFHTGNLQGATALINRAIYVASNLPTPAIRTLAAIAEVSGTAGNLDLMAEHADRIGVFIRGLEMMAKTEDELAQLADMQSELTAASDRVAHTWRPSGLVHLYEQSLAEQSVIADKKKESLMTTLSRARQFLARGQTKPVHMILREMIERVNQWEYEPQSEAILISVYAIAKACNHSDLLSACLNILKAKDLHPDILYQKGDSNPQNSALFELLSASDPRCVAAVSLCLRLSGSGQRLLEFAQVANTAEASIEVMDAIVSQIVHLPGIKMAALRRFGEDILGITRHLSIPSGLGFYYYPGFMLWSTWLGLVLSAAGLATAVITPKLLFMGLILAVTGFVGGILDLLVWKWINLWGRPEISRRLVTLYGSLVFSILVSILILLLKRFWLDPFGNSIFYGMLIPLVSGGILFLIFYLRRLFFVHLSSVFIRVGTAISMIVAVGLGFLFSTFLEQVFFTQVWPGVFLGGMFFLSISLNILPKRITVVRHYGLPSDFVDNDLKLSNKELTNV